MPTIRCRASRRKGMPWPDRRNLITDAMRALDEGELQSVVAMRYGMTNLSAIHMGWRAAREYFKCASVAELADAGDLDSPASPSAVSVSGTPDYKGERPDRTRRVEGSNPSGGIDG
jgi:hypothetical protein